MVFRNHVSFKDIKMTEVTITWFNKIKGYGEGMTSSGESVFVHYKAVPVSEERVDFSRGQVVLCELIKQADRTIAYKIASKSQLEFPFSHKSKKSKSKPIQRQTVNVV